MRSLKDVFPGLLSRASSPVIPGVFRESSKVEARLLLERIFNQNEQAHGLFYLHPQAEIGVGEPSVVMLRVTVALRADDHYKTLLAALRGRLAPEFQAKFGWLIGNLYSRAAAPDWTDVSDGEAKLKRLVSVHLEEQIPGRGPKWVEDRDVNACIDAGITFSEDSYEQLSGKLLANKPKPTIDVVSDEVVKVVKKLGLVPNNGKWTDEDEIKLRNRLKNSPINRLCNIEARRS